MVGITVDGLILLGSVVGTDVGLTVGHQESDGASVGDTVG